MPKKITHQSDTCDACRWAVFAGITLLQNVIVWSIAIRII
jgi:hypothetical protein